MSIYSVLVVVGFSRMQANFSEHLLSLMTNLLLFVTLHMDKKILIKVLVLHLQEWIQKNGVLSIVLKDNLHQPQVRGVILITLYIY